MQINLIEAFAPNTAVVADQALPEEQQQLAVFSFPAYNLETFEQKWNKLARRAAKLGLEAPTWEKARLEERTWDAYNEATGRRYKTTERYLVIVVEARPVVLAGYSFVATIQHTEAGNLLKTVPSWTANLPKEYREAKASWCDHCHTNRRRNETFLVEHTDGTMLRVGRNCLADFVASDRDGVNIVSQMNWQTTFVSFLDELEGWTGSGGVYSYTTEVFAAQVSACIRNEGWISRSKARDSDKEATADLTLSVFAAHRKPSKYNADLRGPEFEPTDADRELATKAIEWARAISPDVDSDYLYNLRVASTFTMVTHKEAGLLASAIPAYSREVEKIEMAKREATLPPRGQRHIGNPGDKFGRKLSAADKRKGVAAHPAIEEATVVSARWFDNDFGGSCKIVFERTTDGHRDIFVWWTGSPRVEGDEDGLRVGHVVTLSGTVKKLSEYKGTKETVLTRCKAELVTQAA